MTELLSWRINKLTGWQEWWVGKGGELVSLMSWWLDEIISRWVFEFVSWWAYKLMSWLVRDLLFFREFISQWADLSYTSYVRRMFILCWYHKDNVLLSIYRNIKSQDDFLFMSLAQNTLAWANERPVLEFILFLDVMFGSNLLLYYSSLVPKLYPSICTEPIT